ncbi:MAG: HAD hydrolase family protein [Proteobacteria bacterium]|nr:HAD hydrolase family protein [Pseudomonadota bacterium]
MLEIEIPGFGKVQLKYLVSDFTGTLSVNGKLLPGVLDKINQLSKYLKIYILTADTFGTVNKELSKADCEIIVLKYDRIDLQKKKFVDDLGAENVISFGNGKNDRYMLKVSKIGVAVMLDEGCAIEALLSADIMVKDIHNAFGLLLNKKRLKATLRF